MKKLTFILVALLMIYSCDNKIDQPIDTIIDDGESGSGNEGSGGEGFGGDNEDTDNGSLSIEFTTREFTGPYDTTVIAVWVETLSGEFVKTVYAQGTYPNYLISLVDWIAQGGEYGPTSDVDGWTSASRPNSLHGTPITTSWDLLNRSGEPVPAGTYRLQIEHTDANAHLIPIEQNVTANGSVEFTIGDTEYSNESSDTYVDISVVYTP